MLETYLSEEKERLALGLPARPLTEARTLALCDLLEAPPAGREALLLDLLTHRVPPGVDEAAKVKAAFLGAIARQEKHSPLINEEKAVALLGTMLGGYSIRLLIDFLDVADLAPLAAEQLCQSIFVFDDYRTVTAMAAENPHAAAVVDAWKTAQWFSGRPPVAEKITLTVFRVDGEITTDDFSPAGQAGTRSDIPLHALSMLQTRYESPLETMAELKQKGYPLAFVGDVVGTGSSRKSAVNSLVWHIGHDIPHVPNKRRGGVVLGGKIAPIFFNTLEDAGALPIECDVSALAHGDTVSIFPHDGRIVNETTGKEVARFVLKSPVLLDEVRAGGRIALIVGRTLTNSVRRDLGLADADIFTVPSRPEKPAGGFTLAQKIVGAACGKDGVVPGEYCEPVVATVGSQDTTGSMTRDELKELACLSFGADLVMQSFCHTAAYPTDNDKIMHADLTAFFTQRGGIALRPGDGVIHSWINRMLLPNTVGTGGDSHTRFPVGISFPAGSGLVAFAAATGRMPLDMPESVLVKFSGQRRPGITLRDMANMIPYAAVSRGFLTVEKKNKQNLFSGRILEMESEADLTVAQAFELTDASAERSAAASTIRLNIERVVEFVKGNVALLKDLLALGYRDAGTISRRIEAMQQWLADPVLIQADADAQYAAVLEIDCDAYDQPILACPNDPDDVRLLSDVAGTAIDEVFIGSCMTNASHFRNAAAILGQADRLKATLWITPPTRMDRDILAAENHLAVFENLGARIEIPGCSLCMGNQARVSPGAVVMSTSTRNFPNRMGDDTKVFLGSAEVAAVCAILGRIPTVDEYQDMVNML
ncbi:MAG: bifunctional aconitate hydratase 2/2-methylisocitrate dehydratase [Thermodesulfobacteriota bacterium]|nr:bifunctional aconitate hydratase 2/2-methylisocitrate dehydratase [Thermodesulfobacteriota bacterium]